MKKVAVFGNAGGGKSTLARRLAALTGLPLHTIDMMQFRAGGEEVQEAEFLETHIRVLDSDGWIIDGFGSTELARRRFEHADTLIHIDLPLPAHFWGVTKRLIKGDLASPEGWPSGSPLWASSLNGYRVLLPCHRELTPKYRKVVTEAGTTKRVHHLKSRAEISALVESIQRETGGA